MYKMHVCVPINLFLHWCRILWIQILRCCVFYFYYYYYYYYYSQGSLFKQGVERNTVISHLGL